MSATELQRVLDLSAEDRLELIGVLWDSLVDADQVPDLTPAQKLEVDRRLERLKREGPTGVPWAEARRRIESQGRPR